MGIGLFQATGRGSRQPPVPPAAVCRRRPAAGARLIYGTYDSLSDVGEIRVYQRADFQSGSRVLKKVF